MTQEEIDEIRKALRTNHLLLVGCVGPHSFSGFEWWPGAAKDGSSVPKRVQCSKCKGVMDAIDAMRYEDGVRHGFDAAKKGAGIPPSFTKAKP